MRNHRKQPPGAWWETEDPQAPHMVLCDLLIQRIRDGVYPPDSVLPSRPALVAELNVSLTTVYTAVGLLVQRGYVRVLGNSQKAINRRAPHLIPEQRNGQRADT